MQDNFDLKGYLSKENALLKEESEEVHEKKDFDLEPEDDDTDNDDVEKLVVAVVSLLKSGIKKKSILNFVKGLLDEY